MQFIISFSAFLLSIALSVMPTHALAPKETSAYFNGPTVAKVTDTTAQVSLSDSVLAGLTDEEKKGVYFEYGETHQVCIMIYPTPEYCLPKKTTKGETSVTLSQLKSDTSYTIKYKRDNTIMCITTPCPGNEFESLSVEFVTKKSGDTSSSARPEITRNLWVGSRGADVISLQTMLKAEGYFTNEVTGYFGGLTMKAVRAYQKANKISQTGYVGPITRKALTKGKTAALVGQEEKFEGTVTAYSTACFADGICSITVDGKTIVTTRGWSQEIVGSVTGIPDFGSIENNIGAHAKVYAKKTEDGYTLYGSTKYYVEIHPKQSKLPAGSLPPTDKTSVEGNTWVWQKTVMMDGSIVTPNKTGMFTVTLNKDGSLSGKTDCNGFFGSYTFGSDGFIKFGALGSTKMFCNGSQEQVFTGSLANADRYSIDGSGNLLLLLSGNAGTLYFVKQ